MSKILYVGLKLTDKSKNDLIELTKELFGDNLPKIYCDHCTLAFGNQCDDFNFDLVGEKTILNSNKIIFDDKCAALVIDIDQVMEFGINNDHPHITLATDGITKPVYSNKLFIQDHDTTSIETISLEAIVTPVYGR